MRSRLDFILIKNKYKQHIDDYHSVVLNSGLLESEITAIGLEEADKIIEVSSVIFRNIDRPVELLPEGSSFIDSDLLRNLYLSLDVNDWGYVYTYAYEYCGFYKSKAKRCLEAAFSIAQNDYQTTCFVLDCDLRYYIAINYNDDVDDFAFDVQLSM